MAARASRPDRGRGPARSAGSRGGSDAALRRRQHHRFGASAPQPVRRASEPRGPQDDRRARRDLLCLPLACIEPLLVPPCRPGSGRCRGGRGRVFPRADRESRSAHLAAAQLVRGNRSERRHGRAREHALGLPHDVPAARPMARGTVPLDGRSRGVARALGHVALHYRRGPLARRMARGRGGRPRRAGARPGVGPASHARVGTGRDRDPRCRPRPPAPHAGAGAAPRSRAPAHGPSGSMPSWPRFRRTAQRP